MFINEIFMMSEGNKRVGRTCLNEKYDADIDQVNVSVDIVVLRVLLTQNKIFCKKLRFLEILLK